MDQAYVPLDELKLRITRFQEQLQKSNIKAALITQRADLFYFSGTGQNAHLFIPAQGEPVLLVKKNLERARRECALREIRAISGISQLADFLKTAIASGESIGLELDVLPANHYFRYQKLLDSFYLTDISSLIRRVRAVKTIYEINCLRRAAVLNTSVFNYAREILREGMSEVDLAAALEAFARSRGHQGAVRMRGFNQEMFFGHVMAGSSASMPSFFDGPTGGSGLNPSYPQGAGLNLIKRNEPVLIDYVAVVDGYMVDQTRVFVIGNLPPLLNKASDTALKIRQSLISLGKPGVFGSALFQIAADLADEAGLGEHFMGCNEQVSFVGHGVGLELDELPVIARNVDQPLEEGMVFALEPKFVFPGLGVVGIEDTFLVVPGGLEPLTTYEERPQLP
jgi:Xaa-Pro aminopeptidase